MPTAISCKMSKSELPQFEEGKITAIHFNGKVRGALTVREFCEFYGLHHSSFYVEVNSGRLKARKRRTRTIVLAEDALAWAKTLPVYQPEPQSNLHAAQQAVA